MKIPRLTSGPFCYSLETWATRMAFSDLTLGLVLAILFFYLTSVTDDITTNPDLREITIGILISLGIIFCIIVFFAIILLIGLYKRNKKLLLIWCYYIIVASAILFLFFFALSISAFSLDIIGSGFIVLAVAVVLTGHEIYAGLIVYSIYLNIKEQEQNNTNFSLQH